MRRKIAIGFLFISVAAAFAAFVVALSLYRSVHFDLSLLSKSESPGRGTVYADRYGRELRFLPDLKGERARWVSLSEIPETTRNAFIAAEDERFYRHHGFDSIAILRALWSNVTKGRVVSGASTISQQVVRLVYSNQFEPPLTRPSPLRGEAKGEEGNRTYRKKLIEIIRSIKMERVLSKDEILVQYLNRVPMGNNLVGVETAARSYFGVSVMNLSASDAALLASLPKAPGMLNPYGSGYPRLLERRNWVLGRMDALGLMPHDKYLTARDEKPRLRKLNFVSAAPHVIDMFQKQFVEGGRIKTTIDLDLQTRVQQILASHADRLKYRAATQAAAIVIHNPTMEVLAAAGSVAYSEKNGGFNNGVLALRSAGSTLKPFLYALAIESGETVSTLIEDTERTYRSREGQYSPLNFDRKEYGPVKMRAALGNSLNLSAVKMLQRVGEERFYDMLVRLDLINHPERGPEHYGLGMAIGNPEVSPEQLATAYAMLANYGIYRNVKYILGSHESEVGRQKTGVRGQKTLKKRYVLLPQTAYIVTDMLSDPTARMLTFSRSRVMMDFPFRVAMKTGTSTFFRDLWAVGYTPDYTVAVWAGNFDGSPTKNLSGSTAAGPIFSDIMTYLYRQSEPVAFKRPKGVRSVDVCGYSGMRPTEHCAHTVSELFIAGTEPKEACTFHTANRKRHELSAPLAGWLYARNRTGSAGRFRLSGFGDDLSKVFEDPWESVAQEREPGVRPRNIRIANAVPAPQREEPQGERHYSIGTAPGVATPPENPVGDSEIKIIYPLDHDRFVTDRSNQGRMIRLQAVVARPVPYVEWFVNGSPYKRTGPPYQAVWKLEQGRYRITAVTPENRGDSVQVEVE